MNFILTTTSHGFSASAWQVFELAAIKRRFAATVPKLMSRFLRAIGSSSPPGAISYAATKPNSLPLRALLPSDVLALHANDAPFERWAALTDAYAEQFLRMQRGDKGARDKAIGLSNEMLRMNKAMECSA